MQEKKVYNHLVICDTLRNPHHVLVEGTALEIFALTREPEEPIEYVCQNVPVKVWEKAKGSNYI